MSIRNWLRAFAIVMLVLMVGASCGLAIDESPRTINSQELPIELRLGQLPTPTPRPASLSGPGSEQVYMLQSDRLVAVERQIVDTPELLLEILLQSTFPEEAAEGISTAIFRGARVQGVEVNDLVNRAIVDLAPGSLDPRNTEQRLAFAQFVYTLTSLPGIDSVEFVSTDPDNPGDGPVELAVQTDTGSTLAGDPVTRADFALLAAPAVPQPAFDIPVATPTPTPDPDAPPVFSLPVWMLDENSNLVQVSRTISRTKEAFLVAVLEGPLLEEQDLGIRSAFPPDALPNSISVSNYEVLSFDEFGIGSSDNADIAIVDLSAGSLPTFSTSGGDNEQFLAVAQIVYTLTELEEIDQVVFSVDGELIPVPSDRGLTLPFDADRPNGLRRIDYASALPEVAAVEPGTLGPVAAPTPTPTPGG